MKPMPKKKRVKPKPGPNKPGGTISIRSEERRAEALRLRKQGLTYRGIASEMGLSAMSARDLVLKGLNELIEDTKDRADEFRELSRERLDDCLNAIYPQALEGDLHAIDRVIKISQELAKLYGCYKQPEESSAAPPFIVVEVETREQAQEALSFSKYKTLVVGDKNGETEVSGSE